MTLMLEYIPDIMILLLPASKFLFNHLSVIFFCLCWQRVKLLSGQRVGNKGKDDEKETFTVSERPCYHCIALS